MESVLQFAPAAAPHPILKIADFGPRVGPQSSLRMCWETYVLPELDDIAPATLVEYDTAFQHWEALTSNPAVQDITKDLVKEFRTKLLATPYRRGKGCTKRQRQPSTVNKTMRHLAAAISPFWPADRHNSGGKGFAAFFEFPSALPRDKHLVFTFDRKAMSALYEAADQCRLASQPHRRSPLYEPLVWRTAMTLALNTGPRTWDLFALRWEDVRWDDFRHGSIFYRARKTGKDQRPPLNRVARVHLDALRAMKLDPDRVFPRFDKHKSFYAAWGRICQAAGVYKPFEQFRKTCSTMHNDITQGVGAWLCGHSARGVNAQHYDNPSRRVLRAVYSLKNPAAFRRGARSLLRPLT